MNAEPVLWNAEDPEGAAAQVGGRPVHVWWSRLRGAFRAVLLEPHRRAGGGTVGWRWRAPAHAPNPSAADLAVLRRRLGGALLDFSDELERAGGGSGDLHEAMHAVVEGLVRASDARFSLYVVPTEYGWMIRSWGFAQPSGATSEIADEDAPAEVMATETKAAATSRPRGKRAVWAVLAVGVIAVISSLAWRWWSGRETAGNASDEIAEKSQPIQSSEKNGAKIIKPKSQVSVQLTKPGGLPAGGAVGFSASHGQTSVAVSRGAHAEELVAAPVPAAFTGLMPVSADEKGDRAGPASRLPGDPEPEISPARPQGDAVDSVLLPRNARNGVGTKTPPRDPGATEETSDSMSPSAKSAEAVNGAPSPAHAAPAVVPPKDGTDYDVEARKISSREVQSPPEGEKNTVRTESLHADEGGEDANGVGRPAKMMTHLSKRSDSATAVVSDVAPNNNSRGPTEYRINAQLTTEVWRVVRVRDVMLATWPAEQSADGDALKTARAQALAAARAEMPASFRAPDVHQGWRLLLEESAWLPTPPVWRDAASGRIIEGQTAERESGWTALELTADMDARLVAADGREYARVFAGKDRRSANVKAAPEVLAIVPWAGVDLAPGETTESRWKWRSLSAGWPDAGWETVREERRVGVRFPSAPDGKTGGILALVDEASGWALACEWSLSR